MLWHIAFRLPRARPIWASKARLIITVRELGDTLSVIPFCLSGSIQHRSGKRRTPNSACDNFLYGFKGAPPARRARAEPAQRDRELKTRSAGEECVRECERDHLVLSGEWRGLVRARGVG